MNQLHQQIANLLTALGYHKDDRVWCLEDCSIGFVVDEFLGKESIAIMLYQEEHAESGYYLNASDYGVAESFIKNVHFLNECETRDREEAEDLRQNTSMIGKPKHIWSNNNRFGK